MGGVRKTKNSKLKSKNYNFKINLEQKNIDYKEKFGDRVLKDLSAFANTEGVILNKRIR